MHFAQLHVKATSSWKQNRTKNSGIAHPAPGLMSEVNAAVFDRQMKKFSFPLAHVVAELSSSQQRAAALG